MAWRRDPRAACGRASRPPMASAQESWSGRGEARKLNGTQAISHHARAPAPTATGTRAVPGGADRQASHAARPARATPEIRLIRAVQPFQ